MYLTTKWCAFNYVVANFEKYKKSFETVTTFNYLTFLAFQIIHFLIHEYIIQNMHIMEFIFAIFWAFMRCIPIRAGTLQFNNRRLTDRLLARQCLVHDRYLDLHKKSKSKSHWHQIELKMSILSFHFCFLSDFSFSTLHR